MPSLSRIGSGQALVAIAASTLALLVGVVSGVSPALGILAAIGAAFAALVFVDLLIGYAAMGLFAFLEVLSVLGGVSLAKVAGALLAVGWLAAAAASGGRTRNFFTERSTITYLLIAFLGWNLMSTAWSPSSSEALTSVMRYSLNALLLPIGYTAVRNRRDGIRMLAALVVGATIAAISAVLSPATSEAAVYDRATGTVGDPNELAAALVVGLAIAAAFAANRHIKSHWRALSALSALLCFAGIMLTLSRGGLLGLFVAMMLAVLLGGQWRRRMAGMCAAVVLLGVFYFTFIASVPAQQRIVNANGGGTGRLSLWTIGLRMIKANPLKGVGTGQFEIASPHYLLRPGLIPRGDLILATPKVAHNTYLNILAELGLVGGVLFFAIIVLCVGCHLAAIRRFQRDKDERMEMLARGLLIGFGGYLVTLMFISDEYAKLLWILLSLGPIMLAVASGAREQRQPSTLSLAAEAP